MQGLSQKLRTHTHASVDTLGCNVVRAVRVAVLIETILAERTERNGARGGERFLKVPEGCLD